MDIHLATEQAYKNGYEKGVKDFAERLRENKFTHKNLGELICVEDIDNLLKQMTEQK